MLTTCFREIVKQKIIRYKVAFLFEYLFQFAPEGFNKILEKLNQITVTSIQR